MKITEVAINRPITILMITLIVILIGVISLMRIPIDLMPDITLPSLSISTSYANVGAAEIESSITKLIEEAVASIADVEDITSVSSEGSSQVTVNFKWGKDLDAAANDIREKLDRIKGRLPDDADAPVIFKFDLAAMPILFLGVDSNMDINELQEFIEDKIKYRIERIKGVASIDINGGRKKQVRILLDKEKIETLNISLPKIVSVLRENNINQPAGYIKEGQYQIIFRALGQYENIEDIENRVVETRNGVPILIKDIAKVEMGLEEVTRIVHVNGKTGVRIMVFKQSGENTVQIAEKVLEEIKKINKDFSFIKIFPLIDSSKYIKDAINNVKTSAMYGAMLAILVLLFFLRNIPSTIIIGITIPISIIATFIFMYGLNFTLNIMSFGGLALGIGMLVDNSIVVLENSYRHIIEEKIDRKKGALIGASEVNGAILASTLTTIAVFLPMIFISGIAGIMFKQIAFVVTFSLICSYITAITIIPTATARLLRIDFEHKNKFFEISEKFFISIDNFYTRVLKFCLNHKIFVFSIVIILFVISLLFIKGLGFEFMPASDEGEIRINVETMVGTNIETFYKRFESIYKIIEELVPELENSTANIGGSWQSSATHQGNIRLKLVNLKMRKRSSEQIAMELTKRLSKIPGIKCRVQSSSGLFFMRRLASSSDKISIELRGDDLKQGKQIADKIADEISKINNITDVKVSSEAGRPEKVIRINYIKAAKLGINVSTINDMINIGLGGKVATYLRKSGKEYDILVKYKNAEKYSIDDLLNLPINLADGSKIKLGTVVDFISSSGPIAIERLNQERVIYINANYAGRDLGSIMNDIKEAINRIPISKEFTVNLGGEYEEQQKSYKELIFVLVIAVLLVYMIMAAQFESFIDPFIVLFSVPLAIIGVIFILLFTNTNVSIQVFIGLIILAGIVVNNAIVLVDYTNLLRREYKIELSEAIITAGRRRLRPILMTTLTTVLGLIPLAIGIGEGSEMQVPLARTVCGGLLSSTFITLFLIPVLYYIFEKRIKKYF
ncbi:MAG TPA: efflux RND transporter permease subunit [bacterium]|mgnify:CR=1 FL=1|nr:efflux RND transporter permease subunit [bacterium]HOL48190.1 efflux RND transporter permease subunit [bacterium]HPQ19609.1 efflux RND transporter permease subunit [bacterium]